MNCENTINFSHEENKVENTASISQNIADQSQNKQQKRVLIIGGGMSGIKIAHELFKNGIEFCLLEYSDYMGGRIKGLEFEGHRVEEGANWVQGLKNEETGLENPIWTMAKEVGLQGIDEDEVECIVRDQGDRGKDITRQFTEIHDNLEEIGENLLEKLKAQDFKLEDDIDAKTALEQEGWETPTSRVGVLAEWMTYDHEYADEMKNLSVFHNILEEFTLEDYDESDYFVTDQRGFSVILDKMLEDLGTKSSVESGIKLNQQVQQICYSDDKVTVISKDLKSGELQTFDGDYVVSTVSIGVLKNNLIKFEPTLPDWKQAAINQCNMAVFCKIFLSFESQFWDDIGEIYIASEKRGKYPYWRPIKNDINANLIMSVVTGEEAKRVERLSEDQIKDEIMTMLFEVYGQKDQNPSDFRPLRAHACKWDSDPRFCGSYSFFAVKAYSGGGYQQLKEPVSGHEDGRSGKRTLFFAGEALSDRYSGYVHGAYSSGLHTAKEIIESIHQN